MLLLALQKHISYTQVLEPPPTDGYYEKFFEQKLDHFTPTNLTTFSYRYYLNDEFYDTALGVAIVHIGGEGQLLETSVNGKYSGYMFAYNMSALLVSLEHRFYGASSPEKTPADLQFLTTEQAVADYASFITFIKKQYGVSKVMVMGGSYPGAMAVILRSQLPHLVDAALASSAPVLAEYDYTAYLRHVYAQFSEAAYQDLAAAFAYLQEKAKLAGDWQVLCEAMRIPTDYCDFSDAMNRIYLYETFTDAVAGIVYYAKPALYDEQLAVGDISRFESEMSLCSGDASCILAALNTFNGSCAGCEHIDYYTMIAQFYQTAADASRMWYFQTCSEYAYYQSAVYSGSVFPQEITTDYFTRVCLDAFYEPMGLASSFEEAVALNKKVVDIANFQRYGALNQPRDKIWYSVGNVDPWTELAMSDEISWAQGKFRHQDSRLSVITYGSHCSDIYLAWKVNDAIRQEQLVVFRKWLGIGQ